jgi:hypothetical protein
LISELKTFVALGSSYAAKPGETDDLVMSSLLAVRMLADRALTDDEWDLVPPDGDLGHLLPVVMARDGRDAAAKLVSKLPAEKRKVLETATMCLSRFVHHDVAEQILVQCV